MKNKNKGTLYLLPSPIFPENLASIPPESLDSIRKVKNIICERARTARRTLKAIIPELNISDLEMVEGGHSFNANIIKEGINWLNSGIDVGLMSEAGSPAIADPGADFVFEAHKQEIKVVPLVGPNSIFMALMASGLGGQNFCFHGYLPNKKEKLIHKLKSLAQNKSLFSYTHICIETPYRNKFLFEHLKSNLPHQTLLCIASDIQSTSEKIITKIIRDWHPNEIEELHKIPSIFLFRLVS